MAGVRGRDAGGVVRGRMAEWRLQRRARVENKRAAIVGIR
jgi:hypothetical protein